MTKLFIDFETRSPVDIKVSALARYIEVAEVLVFGFMFEGQLPQSLQSFGGHFELPKEVKAHVKAGGIVVAHNAYFEHEVWNEICVPRFGWPRLSIEQMSCTMARAYAQGFPGSLDEACKAAGLEHQKDKKGKAVMLRLAKPKANGTFDETPEKLDLTAAYCRQNLKATEALDAYLRPLSESERQVWYLDYEINKRGIALDQTAFKKALVFAQNEKIYLTKQIQELTSGKIQSTQSPKSLIGWLQEQGVKTKSVDKGSVDYILARPSTPPLVRKVLQVRQFAAKSSTAKLDKMKAGVSLDGRLRFQTQYHGAATGRFAGRHVQIQNLPTGNLKAADVEKFLNALTHEKISRDEIELLYGPPLNAISSAIRGFFIPAEGHWFYRADFASIEARVLAWLAGEEKTLNVFRTHGKLYETEAASFFNSPIETITPDQRNLGKVMVLAFGYQGGTHAFHRSAAKYKLQYSEEIAERAMSTWRSQNQQIVSFWYELENKAREAIGKPGVEISCRKCSFKKIHEHLYLALPSKRLLCFPFAKMDYDGKGRVKIHYETLIKGKWKPTSTYGGSLANNVTQATARDLLVAALFRLKKHGYPTVFHVHDEVICEVPKSDNEKSLKEFNEIMSLTPSWATDLPVKAEGFRGERFRK